MSPHTPDIHALTRKQYVDRRTLLDCALLLCCAAITFFRTLGNDFILHWDDNLYVVNNETIRGFSFEHIFSAFKASTFGQYNPLALISFMADYTLWGLNPSGYHLTNLLIHATNGLLVYYLLSKLHGERLLALVGGALFIVHPVQVESVAWISERKGLLSMFFFLLSLEGYRRYREAGEGRGGKAYIASVSAFILSLLAKSMTVVMPLVLLMYDFCFPADRRLRLKDKIPFVVAAAVFSAVQMYSEMPQHGGSRTTYHGGSPLATFYTMLPVFCRYMGLLVWPAGLNIEPSPPIHTSLDWTVAGAAFVLAGVLSVGIFLFRVDRRLGFWATFFWIPLLPVSQIVPLFLLMYEHYLYMPLMGIGALAGAGLASLRRRIGGRRQAFLYTAVVLWLSTLAVLSVQREGVWRNTLALFTDAAEKSPNSFRVWDVLGEANRLAGNMDAAIRSYERSLEIFPNNTDTLWFLGDLHTELGNLDKGYPLLKKTLEINPSYVRAWNSLGNNYLKRGDVAAAGHAYKRAQVLQPEALQVMASLGNLARAQKRLDLARVYYERIEAAGGDDPANAYRMACIESMAGKKDESLKWLEKALQRGYRDYKALGTNEELSALWNDSRFNWLLLRYFPEPDEAK